ncbi:HAMP domain-containing sensor histidine kinase [Ekhidna sp.]|uniref:sensor histidine kinase n=1 Tax=Ekhidna sp. TaxID=2608089 RepID=UPI0032EF9660
MNIRNKITLIFIALTGSLMSVVFVIIYLFSYNYTDSEFFDRLTERANIVAQIRLEKDELSTQLYDEIRKKHVQILPNEKEAVYKIDDINNPILPNEINSDFPPTFKEKLSNQEIAFFKSDNTYFTGIIYSDNEGDFVVIASADNVFGKAKMNNLRAILIIALLSSLVALFIIGRYYAGKVLKPIAEITNQVKEITGRNLHLRLHTKNNKDELAELSNTFNDLLDRLETTFDLQISFINNASHELKNPLAAILGETEYVLNKSRSANDYQASIQSIEKEAKRLDLLINNLLELAQAGHEEQGLLVESLRVDELIFLAKDKIDEVNPANNVKLDLQNLPDDQKSLIIHGNQSLLLVAFVNIIDNACKFSDNKKVNVKISAISNQVEITIEDQGIGIPRKDLAKVFEPLYRSENARGIKGFGVGLSLAQKIIKIHQGILSINSEVGKGTSINIRLNCIE